MNRGEQMEQSNKITYNMETPKAPELQGDKWRQRA